MAEYNFFKKYEERGGDGLTDEERRIYEDVMNYLNTETQRREPFTRKEFKMFLKANRIKNERFKNENNPKNIVVNIRPGVPLKIKLSNGQIDDGWIMGFGQSSLHLGQVCLEKNARTIVLSIKDLAELNDLNEISSNPENVMEYSGFRISNYIKIKATGETYLIRQFVNDNGEVKVKVEVPGSNDKLFRINEIDKIPEPPLSSPDSKMGVNRREAIKTFGAGVVAGLLGDLLYKKFMKTPSEKPKSKDGKPLK